jgi:hypothetical protein
MMGVVVTGIVATVVATVAATVVVSEWKCGGQCCVVFQNVL